MSDNRVVTKQHIFNFEMKYKSWLLELDVSDICYDTEFSLKVLDDLCTKNIFRRAKDVDLIFEFLDDYKDIIYWDTLIIHKEYFVKEHLDKFLSKYNTHFNIFSWRVITEYIVSTDIIRYKLVRKYKDILNWEILSKNMIRFNKQFTLEMVDYIEPNALFESATRYSNYFPRNKDFLDQLRLYTEDHLKEILSYKREE